LKAASEAAKLADMPWCATMSFDTAGRTMMGLTSKALTALAPRLAQKPLAFGANCGVGASDLLRTVLGFEDAKMPIIAKGNAGIPKFHNGHIHYDGTPELMADYACLARPQPRPDRGRFRWLFQRKRRHGRRSPRPKAHPPPRPRLRRPCQNKLSCGPLASGLSNRSQRSFGSPAARPSRLQARSKRLRSRSA